MKQLKTMQYMLMLVTTLFSVQCLAADKAAVLDWRQRLELSTPVSGIITQIKVDVGQMVGKNQLLIKLDERGFQAQLKKAKSILSRAIENHAEAKREKERALELFDRTAISVHELELVKIDYAKAFADLNEAQAELAQAQLDLEYTEIRSPLVGQVVQMFAHQNQTISNRLKVEPLVIIASSGQMLARAHLQASDLHGLKTGQTLDIRIENDTLSGTITRVGLEPVANNQTPMYALEVEFDTAGKTYRKGQAASIILP